MWIINFRFLLLAIVNEPSIWTLFADPIYILRKPNLATFSVGISGLFASMVQILFIIFERSPDFRPIIQFYSSNRYHYGLWNRNYRKFCLKSKLMARCVLGPLLRISVFGLAFFYMDLVIKAYFDSDFKFPIIKSIVSTTVILI